jgi:hypothetical protein
MIARCNSPKHPGYRKYGARGIKVCSRWLSFAAFLADMGERPAGKTLGRECNSGNYEPGNCRWITVTAQNQNRSSSVLSLIDRERMRDMAWLLGLRWTTIGRYFGVSPQAAQYAAVHGKEP